MSRPDIKQVEELNRLNAQLQSLRAGFAKLQESFKEFANVVTAAGLIDLEDQRDDPEYQAFMLEVAATCSADDRPCDSCLAGGICDGPSRTDDYFDEDDEQ